MLSFGLKRCELFVFLQLEGMIVAPNDPDTWGRGLMWWIEFTKLKGIKIQGNGVIDGRGTVWWQQDQPFDYPIDDDFKLIVPLNNSVQERPPMPVKKPSSLIIIVFLCITSTQESSNTKLCFFCSVLTSDKK